MRKDDKKGLKIVFLAIVVIVAIIFVANNGTQFSNLAVSVDLIEQNLNQNYIRLWGSATDKQINQNICQQFIAGSEDVAYYSRVDELTKGEVGCVQRVQINVGVVESLYSDELFTSSNSQNFGTDSNSIYVQGSYGRGNAGNVQIKKQFIGQEVVVLVSGGVPVTEGSCSVSPLPSGAGNLFKADGSPITIKYIPYTLDTTRYRVEIDGSPIGDVKAPILISVSCSVGGGRATNKAKIEFIGYNPEFACDIDTKHEVWVTERYASQVTRKDLTFEPTKWCYNEHPPTLRVENQGEKRIEPNPLNEFNRGIPLPSNRQLNTGETISITYATNFVTGLIDPLAPDERWICTRRDTNNKCSNWAVEKFIDALEIVKQCKQDSDCPQPLANSCPNYFIGCDIDTNLCKYDDNALNAIACKNEVVTVVKQIETIKENADIKIGGDNVFVFSQNKDRNEFYFGNEKFTSTIPSFSCVNQVSNDLGTIKAPNPSNECWATTTSFLGKLTGMLNTQTLDLDSNIQVTYLSSGDYILDSELKDDRYLSGYRHDNWGNSFYFNVRKGLAIQIIDSFEEHFIVKGSNKQIKLNVINNLPTNQEAFVRMMQIIKATNEKVEKDTPIILQRGANSVFIDGFDSIAEGESIVDMQVYYPVQADTLTYIKSPLISTSYLVKDEFPTAQIIEQIRTETIIKEIPVEVPIEVKVFVEREQCSLWCKIVSFIKSIIAIG